MSEAGDVLEQAREVTEFFFAQEWSDGLPVVSPTPAGVEAMLHGTRRDRDEVIAALAPGWGRATVERIAVNGLMAGCRPEYMPVLIAAVQAVADERYGLQGTQGTTDCIASVRPRRPKPATDRRPADESTAGPEGEDDHQGTGKPGTGPD